MPQAACSFRGHSVVRKHLARLSRVTQDCRHMHTGSRRWQAALLLMGLKMASEHAKRQVRDVSVGYMWVRTSLVMSLKGLVWEPAGGVASGAPSRPVCLLVVLEWGSPCDASSPAAVSQSTNSAPQDILPYASVCSVHSTASVSRGPAAAVPHGT